MLLIVDIIKTGADTLQIIVLFIITALGGMVLLQETLPKSLALLHSLLALTVFKFLLI